MLIAGCDRKTDVDRCVEAQMKVYDNNVKNDPYSNSTEQDRDNARATAYLFCRGNGS
jgi:hypothetical protein